MSLQSSTYMAMFPSTDQAVWIKTNEGIVEVIFFGDASEVEQIHITKQLNKAEGRYLYIVQAPSPTLLLTKQLMPHSRYTLRLAMICL
jgi:hypothetical protein